jgi:hypothetical protein
LHNLGVFFVVNQTLVLSKSFLETFLTKIAGFAGNTGLFAYHVGLMKFLPLLVLNMKTQLYTRAKETIANITRANYLYITAYPTYSGYKIEHDPIVTIYLTIETPQNWLGILLITGIATIIIVTSAMLIRRRKPKQPQQTLQPP